MAFIESGKTFDKDENYEKMKKRMDNMDTCQYPLRIPAPLYKKVKMKLVRENTKLRTVLIDMLEEYIKKQ
jgi:hypothetical protein